MNAQFEIAVLLSPAVQRFQEIRRIYDNEAMAIPTEIEDGWDKLMRIRDYAEEAI